MAARSVPADIIDPPMNVDPAASERQLGLPMSIALIVGNMIGSGIFLLPALLAPFGPSAIYGWVVTIAGSMVLAATLALLSARIEGGPFVYVEEAFGRQVSFLVMWSYLVSMWTANASLGIAAVSNFSHIVPSLNTPMIAPMVAIAIIWAFTLVNTTGARNAGRVQTVTTLLKALPLVAVVLVAAAYLSRGATPATQADVRISTGSVASVAALAMFSMLGFESATVSCDKVKNPHRNIPIASVTGAAATGMIYLAATWSVLYLLPAKAAAASPSPFADAVQPLVGPVASSAIALFAVISALGALNGWILCSGEVPLKLARDGAFPAWFGKTTGLGTPVRAQVLAAVAASLLIGMNYSRSLTGIFGFLTLISVTATFALYTGCTAAALTLVARKKLRGSALGVCGGIGLLFSIWTYWGAGLSAALWGLALLASGVPILLYMKGNRRSGISGSSRGPETSPAALPE
ncbi:amino acid permease [Sphingomonas sp.]|uniref:APC family permease n=1 Tax=Sphingomonas sp. TaxID=28214 RepID=UPI0025EA32E2|nr:amino acid permease [Sphingomonas sp.]MBV9529275.1 amino acid permease [Sphingomonas sp.]